MIFALIDSDPFPYTRDLSPAMLREIALIRQQDEIIAYDSAKSTSEDEVRQLFTKKDGRDPCEICSSGNSQFNQEADKNGVYHKGLHSSSQSMKFCKMNADLNYRGEYYCMTQKRFHHYVTGPTMILIVGDQVIGNIGNLLNNMKIQTPICFEFLYMPECNIREIAHAIKLQFMHMGKSMNVILQGGIIQSIKDAKKSNGSVNAVTNSILKDLADFKRCLEHMDDQLTPSTTYGIRESFLYPVQSPYPPKYCKTIKDETAKQPEGDLSKYIDDINSQIYHSYRNEGILNRSGITAKCDRAFSLPRMDNVGGKAKFVKGAGTRAMRVQESHKLEC